MFETYSKDHVNHDYSFTPALVKIWRHPSEIPSESYPKSQCVLKPYYI